MHSRVLTSVSLRLAPVLLVLCWGCGYTNIDTASLIRSETTTNGFTMNGFTMNGFTMNGFTMNGFTMNGFTMNGFTMNGLALNQSLFSAVTDSGTVLSGLNLIGAQAQITVQPSGQAMPVQYKLRFDNIYVDPQKPSGDVYLYDISYTRSGETTWTSLCADANGAPVPAIPIKNYWNTQTGARIDNPNVVTFACVSGALGKCVRLGYRPWAQATKCVNQSCSAISLAGYHQACTRMIRADYCGNGSSYTLNGTLIEVYDGLSPQIQTRTSSWAIEGQWNPEGAFCIGDARHAELLAKGRYPDCNGDGNPGDVKKCGSNAELKLSLLGSAFSSAPN